MLILCPITPAGPSLTCTRSWPAQWACQAGAAWTPPRAPPDLFTAADAWLSRCPSAQPAGARLSAPLLPDQLMSSREISAGRGLFEAL